MTLGDWLESFAPGQESEAWAFFLPAVERAALVWATDAARAELAGHLEVVREGAPQLQDVLEDASKVRNARAAGDELRLRLAAHDMATRIPGVLALVNPPVLVETRAEALAAALAFPVAPEGYREDMLDCLGMSGRAVAAADLHDTALRLALGALRLLRPSAASVAGRIEPGMPEYLESGWLERLLTQE
jgi:phosphoribosyl-AMP cyclohydrolase